LEKWNDGMATFGQLDACGEANKLQSPASSPSKKFFSLSLWLVV
jgi:hypothetical protein